MPAFRWPPSDILGSMRGLVLLGLCACADRLVNSDPNTSVPERPLAVGATAEIGFLPDLCAGPQRDANTTLYTCSDDSVASVNSATVASPFEIVSSSSAGVRFKANAAGDATVSIDYVNRDGEQGDMSFAVRARAVERIDLLSNTTLCPSQRVLAGEHLFASYGTYGTDAGKTVPLISATLLQPSFTNATLVSEPQPGRVRVAVGTVGTATLASSLGSGATLEVEVVDPATASLTLTAPTQVNRYADIYLGISVMAGGAGACLPHGPWTVTFAPSEVCGFHNNGSVQSYNDLYANPSPTSIRGRAYQGTGTCTVTVTHGTLPLSATAQITVCPSGC